MPKYLEIARQLREEIGSSYEVGQYLPSERSLQKLFSVTAKTVRKALEVLSSEGLVETLPYRGTVVSDGLNGSSGASVAAESKIESSQFEAAEVGKTVALVMPLEEYLLGLMVGSVESELQRHGFRLQLCGTPNSTQTRSNFENAQKKERQVLESLRHDGVAGVIWWSVFGPQNYDIMQDFQKEGLPIVLVDNSVAGLHCDTVGIDDYGASFRATTHLLQQNREVAFFGYQIDDFLPPVERERMGGFIGAIQHAFPELFDEFGPISLDMSSASRHEVLGSLPAALRKRFYFHNHHTIDELLAQDPQPTGILVASDHLAYDLIHGLRERDRYVPEDVAVVSFGDIERNSPRPSSLTTVRQPFEAMGQRAVRLIMQRLSDPKRPLQHIQLPAELYVRQTCGASQGNSIPFLYSPTPKRPQLSPV